MKKIGIGSLILLIGVASIFSSCKKYQYGPAFSLHSKTSRIVNDWSADQLIDSSGTDVTSTFTSYELMMTKTGGATLTIVVEVLGTPFTMSTVGTWALTANGTEIIFDFDQNIYDNTSTILKLKVKELWLLDSHNNEYHLIPKV